MSDRARGRPLPSEPTLAYTYEGLSVYDIEAGARRTAKKWKTIGDHIAELSIRPDAGISARRTGYRGHYTLFGEATAILAMVGRVVPV